MNKKKNIVVIGAGVSGLSCAVKIIEYFGNQVNVTLIAEHTSPNTTGDISAGFWGPYLYSSTSTDLIKKWSKKTHDFWHLLWKSGLANEVGISLLPMVFLTCDPNETLTSWDGIVYHFSDVTPKQIQMYSQEHKQNYIKGIQYLTFSCQVTRLLPYLMKRFIDGGGIFQQKRIESINELIYNNNTQQETSYDSYDIIINCTGLQAKYFVNDNGMHPIRGQVLRVQAPWLFQTILNDDYYLIPNADSVILGGTHQCDDYNQNVSVDDSEFIVNGCKQILPSIANAPVIKEFAGLRPGRTTVRLEEEFIQLENNKTIQIIHNYGHGGCGVTLSWGCAAHVLQLVINNVNNYYRNEFQLNSKL